MKALITGWFTFADMGATAGDIMAHEVVRAWLEHVGIPCDVALTPPFEGGVNWETVDCFDYSHLLFVCGPFGESETVRFLLQRFAHCQKIGINVSMLQDLEDWNPFHLLLERDSSRTARPDITFAASRPKVPVVGVCLVEPQHEYGDRSRHQDANKAIHRVLEQREAATVQIDTRLDINSTGLRTPAEIESLITRMDVMLTTRLHGIVLSLKNGVPVIAIDAILGGAKVSRQARRIGWPHVFAVDTLDQRALLEAFDFCVTDEARALARECAAHAIRDVEATRKQLITSLRLPSGTTGS